MLIFEYIQLACGERLLNRQEGNLLLGKSYSQGVGYETA